MKWLKNYSFSVLQQSQFKFSHCYRIRGNSKLWWWSVHLLVELLPTTIRSWPRHLHGTFQKCILILFSSEQQKERMKRVHLEYLEALNVVINTLYNLKTRYLKSKVSVVTVKILGLPTCVWFHYYGNHKNIRPANLSLIPLLW